MSKKSSTFSTLASVIAAAAVAVALMAARCDDESVSAKRAPVEKMDRGAKPATEDRVDGGVDKDPIGDMGGGSGVEAIPDPGTGPESVDGGDEALLNDQSFEPQTLPEEGVEAPK